MDFDLPFSVSHNSFARLNVPYIEFPSVFSVPGDGRPFGHHEKHFSLLASRLFHSLHHILAIVPIGAWMPQVGMDDQPIALEKPGN
jgi:hypothetical protein